MGKKLYKARRGIKIDGVCAGIANYFGLDVTLVRLGFLALLIFGGSGAPLYIACCFIMPREPEYTVDDAEN